MSARRRTVVLLGAVALLLLLVVLPARADVMSNVAPASQLPDGALADAYPLGSYLLDHHFDAVKAGVLSGVDVSGIPPLIAWFLAQAIWQLTAFLANAVITLFTFAFSLDLVNGSAETGGGGALEPVAAAVRTIYRDVFGQAWLTVAVLLAGMWAIWNALVRRRYTETAGALATSVLFVVIALAFVTQPERTIGTATRWTNQMSGAFLSLSANGTITDHDEAKRQVSDQLFKLLIHDPWVVLNFGGLEHCVRNGGSDDPDSVPVRPLTPNPTRDAQLARQLRQGQQVEADGKVCVNNASKYAPHFLRFPFHSEQRDAEYEALKAGDAGKLPDEDPGKRDGTYRLSAIDKPAAEAMGKEGQYDRLGLAVVILLGQLGAYLLLGSLAVMVIVAQVLVLLLLAFAPVALVVGVFPKRGHEFFIGWLQRLGGFLVRKAVFSLVLAVLLAVSNALAQATGNLGWLMAFGMQAVFFWTVFLYRRQLTGPLTTAVTGRDGAREESRVGGLLTLYAAGRLTRRALRAGRAAVSRRQQPAPPALPQPLSHRRDDEGEAAEPDASRAGRGEAAPADPAHDARSAAARPRDGETERPTAPPERSSRGEDQARDSRPAVPPRSASGRHVEPHGGRLADSPPPAPERRAEPHDGKTDRPTSTEGGHARAGQPPSAVSAEQADRPDPPRPRPRAGDNGHGRGSTASGGEGRARRRESDSPLAASLRRDAQRLHHDAARLHKDAQQLHEHDDAPRAVERPAPPPRRPTGSDANGGERR